MKKISNDALGITPETEFIDSPNSEGNPGGFTDAQAQKRAADVIRRRNLIPGGKSLSGNGKHSPVLQVRSYEKEHETDFDFM